MTVSEQYNGDLKLIQIEDGFSLWVVSEVDARLEAQQLRPENQVYIGPSSGGLIQLRPGGTVIDVGANVGSFARLAAQMLGPAGRVIALEPVPSVFEALRRNAEGHAQWCTARGVPTAPIEPVHAGILPNTRQPTQEFVIFPRCTAMSCLAACRDDADATQATLSIVRHDPNPPVSGLQALGRWMARRLPWVYAPIHNLVFRSIFLRSAHTVSCPVATLGRIIKERKIQSIDLLKINVERGEMGVLLSVPAKRWQQVQQVALQLHDRQGALACAYALLGSDGPGGFEHVRHWKEPRFASCCLVQVYAARRAPPAVTR